MTEEYPVDHFQISWGDHPYNMTAIVVLMGDDLILSVGGGEKPHIGSTAVAYQAPDENNAGQRTIVVKDITILNHKEKEIVRSAAMRLAEKFNCNVQVSAGLHVDHATKEAIEKLVENFDEMIEKTTEKLEIYCRS